ncbi:MAG: DUF1801 domain-containing protein [Ectothiorhodospiraceae bacterium]|nr:DUF1801 domain-containing protein [Ectothiorhodospiraceae bacterium]
MDNKKTGEITNPTVAAVFKQYPDHIRAKIMVLRQLVLETAVETADITTLEETLKWGEPSYLTKNGSTIRMHWKKSSPNQYALYFNCKTTLVDTFKELYGSILTLEGNRAILFNIKEKIPKAQIKHCILLALTYHRRKHLPMLGV